LLVFALCIAQIVFGAILAIVRVAIGTQELALLALPNLNPSEINNENFFLFPENLQQQK
jgi:hypothetical protein